MTIAHSKSILPFDQRFAEPASSEQLARAADALRANGFAVVRTSDAAGALRAVTEALAPLPPDASVFDATSATLGAIGVSPAFLGGLGYTPLRDDLDALGGPPASAERRRAGAAPDAIVGSVHAVTEAGEVVVASASGSQLGPYASGAGLVIWVVGAQKVVPILAEGLRRVREYSYALEDARARVAYGVPSTIGKLLVVQRELFPGRTTVILVDEPIGY